MTGGIRKGDGQPRWGQHQASGNRLDNRVHNLIVRVCVTVLDRDLIDLARSNLWA